MNMSPHTCDLCGLPIPDRTIQFDSFQATYGFCCLGCKQVFIMLMEASEAPDPATFRQSELFRKCQAMGIIPRLEADRVEQSQIRGLERSEPIRPENFECPEGEKKDYNPNTLNLVLKIKDMWCPACAWIIEEVLKKTKGITHAACSFSSDRVRCDYNPILASPDQIIAAIQALGYHATTSGTEGSKGKNEDFIRLVISAFLTLNVMMLSFSLYTGFFIELSADTISKLSWPICIMASIVLLYGGRKIYSKALTGLSSAAFGMETLITAGAFCAYIYSTVNLLSGNIHLYYDTAAMLITLVLLGKALERRAKDKVQVDLESFFSLQPTKIKICSSACPQGRYVAAKRLKVGDVFQTSEDEIVPADGRILEGFGCLDESSLTGEAVPIHVNPGDRVRAGTAVVRGTLRVKSDAVGPNSTLGQMIQTMERALDEKTRLEGRTDKILQWFVPFILTLAVLTGLVCMMRGLSGEAAMIRAVTVMVISCPCALGIAIPLARVAGISVAGKKGILVRAFSCFEQVSPLNSIVFDKTGTITQGKWKLLNIIAVPPFTVNALLTLAASLEKRSDHYIGREIKRQAENKNLKPIKLDEIAIFDNGISGYLGNEKIKIGSKYFLAEELQAFDTASLKETAPDDAIHSSVFMSRAGKICAIFVFGDQIRPTAENVIKKLQVAGYRNFLVSGDGDKTTKAVGKKIGINQAYGNKLPREKALFIDTLRKMGHQVAMVGDGINDAPALVQADLSMAIHSANHLGKDVADITLMRGDPSQVLEFLKLAKGVNKKISQNLIYAFLYNLGSIPLAVSGLLSPLIAVCAMLLSSLTVIGNTILFVRKTS